MMRIFFVLVLAALLGLPGAAGAEGGPVALTGPGELAEFYRGATGYAPDGAWFGVYDVLAVGDELFLGLGTARPAEYDGALLAKYDGGLAALAKLDEQGFIDMSLRDGRIYMPGADPMDGWEAGNLYVHDVASGTTTKLRTLPNVIHAWQARVSAPLAGESDGRLRVTVGRYLPEKGAAWPWAGGILTSADGGQSWTADDSPALGTSRTYDLVEGAAGDVALVDDADISGCQLATRSAGGGWVRGSAWVMCRLRLATEPGGRRALAVGVDGHSLVVPGAQLAPAREQRIALPFGIQPWAYHWWALAGRTLFVATDDGRVMGTTNLRTWREVARLDGTLVSVGYWPARGSLVVGTRGADAGLWAVPVGTGN